jgi:hypothetical protein
MFVHSCFIENPPVDLEAMNPSFMRWFCHIQSPRWLGIARELPRLVVESQKICIFLLFMGIDSGELSGPW